MSSWTESRRIAQRVIITGTLQLLTPAHLGNGERGEQVDMQLLRDPQDHRPLLTGTSIVGALRNYLQAHQYGDFVPEDKEQRESAVALLFGGVKGDAEGEQSPLIVDDAWASITAPEIRDGVKIEGQRRIALSGGKYDIELLPTGTTFELRFELLLPSDEAKADSLRSALVCALQGFEQAQIALGARKSRGFGRCVVPGWHMTTYNLRDRDGLLAWLTADLAPLQTADDQSRPIADLLQAAQLREDQRKLFTITAAFALDSPLLIRSEEPLLPRPGEPPIDGDNQPDFAHLCDNAGRPVVSGTSLAGVLRARATRILNTVRPHDATSMVNRLFGRDLHTAKGATASRLVVQESTIEQGQMLVQNRVAIDRFTGGAFETALFGEAPQVGGTVEITLTIRNPQDEDKGLLLLLLKDLWTGDLPIGGTSSIGRGRLRGMQATINDKGTEWKLTAEGARLVIPDDARQRLEGYVKAIHMTKERRDA